jgi:DGQHR domain-containing protein
MQPNNDEKILVRALHTVQKPGIDTYAFFLPGALLTKIADISRVTRDEHDHLKGFQRKEIRNHVRSIVEYLDQGDVLFPNAIILALGPDIEFKHSRGPVPAGLADFANSGTLSIPLLEEGNRMAWIVDGQQRSIALSKTRNKSIPVPVVAFVCPDIEIQREQFILVNKARPLPPRLIDELLPEVSTLLPRDLSARRLPSELCNLLNRDPRSPFHQIIKRMSDDLHNSVVTDSALEKAIERNLKAPIGALSQYRGLGGDPSDTASMYGTLLMYWSAVKDTFPEAWGHPATVSRLMHSAGIRAMGALMDQILLRAEGTPDPRNEVIASLKRIRSYCRWTEGIWDGLGWQWNEVQSTPVHIARLIDYLSRLDRDLSRRAL